LPFEFFRPVLPSARHLKITEIESDSCGNPILPQQLFLLDCPLEEKEIFERYPNLWQYLETGKKSIANNYLCRNRKCWYFQEYREVPLYICNYMGRISKLNKNAFRFILNKSKAIVTNSYLALYPHKFIYNFLIYDPILTRTIWEMLNKFTALTIYNEGRLYGGGLQKIEPKELLNIDVPFLKNLLPTILDTGKSNKLF
jgi:hypothetical protein